MTNQDIDQTGGPTMPANMIDNGGPTNVSSSAMDHASGPAVPGEDDVTSTDGPQERAIPAVRSGSLYIAGPMTGLPEFNYPAFRAAAVRLREAGWWIEDPSTNTLPEGSEWIDYMRVTIPQMLRCAGVAVLPGWGDSRGANLEVRIARALSMPVQTVDEWISNGYLLS